jgi:hypothetical protein
MKSNILKMPMKATHKKAQPKEKKRKEKHTCEFKNKIK